MQKNNIFRNSIWLLPVLILIGIAAGFAFAIFIGRIDFALRGLGIAIPALIASFFLVLLSRSDENLMENRANLEIGQKALTSAFALLFMASILLLIVSPDRTWIYYFVITAISMIILLQILSPNLSPNLILVEIVITLLEIIYSVTLTVPFYFGYTDLLLHIRISELIYISGHTIPLDYILEYANFPLYHILMAESAFLTGIDLKTVLFLVTAPVYTMLVVIIYYIFNKAIDNRRVALLASLSFAFSSTVIFYGSYMVTRVMAFVGFVFMVYFLYKIDPAKSTHPRVIERIKNRNITFNALAVLMAVFIILVHQVSVFQISIILLILMICEWVSRNTNIINTRYIKVKFYILFNFMFIVYWLYVAYDFATYLVASKFNMANFEGGAVIKETIVASNVLSFLVTNIPMSFFLFFALVGIGYFAWRMRDSKKYAISICLFVLAAMILYVPNPLQTLWQTMSLFRFDRFVLLVSPFMAFAMGLGIFILHKYLNNLKLPAIFCLAVIALLFGGYTLFSSDIMNISATTPREYFNTGEISSFNFVKDNVTYNSFLYSDIYSIRYFVGLQNFSETAALNLPYYRIDPFPVDNASQVKGYKILRYGELQDHGLYTGTSEDNPFYINSTEAKNDLVASFQSNDKIYSNYDTDIYVDQNYSAL